MKAARFLVTTEFNCGGRFIEWATSISKPDYHMKYRHQSEHVKEAVVIMQSVVTADATFGGKSRR